MLVAHGAIEAALGDLVARGGEMHVAELAVGLLGGAGGTSWPTAAAVASATAAALVARASLVMGVLPSG